MLFRSGEGSGSSRGDQGGASTSGLLWLLSKKLYDANAEPLKSCAACKSRQSFFHCLQSLQRPYDLTSFFGGMSKYHNTKYLMQKLNIPNCPSFPSNYVGASDVQGDHHDQQQRRGTGSLAGAASEARAGSQPDNILVVGNTTTDVHCISVRIWDVLLWFSIIKRPRRDVGIIVEFANTLVEYSMKLLPRSVFPFDMIPMSRLDHVTGEQVVMDLRIHHYTPAAHGEDTQNNTQQQQNRRDTGFRKTHDTTLGSRGHPIIIREKNVSICSGKMGNFVCKGRCRSGLLEDEAYMSSFFMMSELLGCKWQELPLDRCGTLRFSVEFGNSYPLIRYNHSCKHIGRLPGSKSSNLKGAKKGFQEVCMCVCVCVCVCVCMYVYVCVYVCV